MTVCESTYRRLTVLLALVVLMLIGCGKGGPPAPPPEEPATGEPLPDRGFDPLGLPQDDRVMPKVSPQKGLTFEQQPFVVSDPMSIGGDTAMFAMPGIPVTYDTLNYQAYRVQLLTTKLYGEARQAERVAREIFDQPVYVDYEVPYYKLRVGSYADRESAEQYQQRAKSAGYSHAWVVLVMVDVKQARPLYDLDSAIVPDSITVDPADEAGTSDD